MSVTGRDLSSGMLERAKQRAMEAGRTVSFHEGNILAIDEPDGSFDYVFVSFALHLFSPQVEAAILHHLFRVAKKCVIIIDHSKRWEFMVALVEWIEGGHYDQYLTVDFKTLAQDIGCRSFEEVQIEDCAVMTFSH